MCAKLNRSLDGQARVSQGKRWSSAAGFAAESLAMLLATAMLVMFVQIPPSAGGTDAKDASRASESFTLPISSMPSDDDGSNRIGNFALNSTNGGLMAWQSGWTFFVDPSGLGGLCAIPDAGGAAVSLTDFPVANLSVMGDRLIFTDICATVMVADGRDGEQRVRYPDSTGFMRDIVDQTVEGERIVWGGNLYVMTGVHAFMETGAPTALTFAPIDLGGGVCYYPVMTDGGIWTSCMREGILPLEGFGAYEAEKSAKGKIATHVSLRNLKYASGVTTHVQPLAVEPPTSYQLLKSNGVLQLARVTVDPDGDPAAPYSKVEFLMQIGDGKTRSTGFSPILGTEKALYVETYQEPESMTDGNWRQPTIMVIDPENHSRITQFEGRFPRAYGEDVVFLDAKGRIGLIRNGEALPEPLTDGPAIASYDVLSNGDIAFTYYTDDSSEVRQGLLSRNAYDGAYRNAALGDGSRSASMGWYAHMNILDGMLDPRDEAIRNNAYCNDKDTFVLKKDEQGLWRWYRLSKNEDGGLDFTLQRTMRLPEDKERENEWNSLHDGDATEPSDADGDADTSQTDSSASAEGMPGTAAESAADGAENADDTAVLSNSPAMQLIYDRHIAESSEPCLSQEELDKKWVLELAGKGTFKVLESGVSDREAYVAAGEDKFAGQFDEFSATDRQAIYGVSADMERELAGKTGELTFATNALPGFSFLDTAGTRTNEVGRKTSINGSAVTLTLANDAFDLHLTCKDEPDYLLLDNQSVTCSAVVEGKGSVAFRAHFYLHEDGSAEIKGLFSFVDENSTAWSVMEFNCDVTASNIS